MTYHITDAYDDYTRINSKKLLANIIRSALIEF